MPICIALFVSMSLFSKRSGSFCFCEKSRKVGGENNKEFRYFYVDFVFLQTLFLRLVLLCTDCLKLLQNCDAALNASQSFHGLEPWNASLFRNLAHWYEYMRREPQSLAQFACESQFHGFPFSWAKVLRQVLGCSLAHCRCWMLTVYHHANEG